MSGTPTIFTSIFLLVAAAILGVAIGTTASCGVGLIYGSDAWCYFSWVWSSGFPLAVAAAFIYGIPLVLICRLLGLRRWWQFGLGALLIAFPVAYFLAHPLRAISAKGGWNHDVMAYLGCALLAGLIYGWMAEKLGAAQRKR